MPALAVQAHRARPFSLVFAVLALMCGCGGDAARPSVSAGAWPDAGDGSVAGDGGPKTSPRGEVPRWPSAGDEIVLPYRQGEVDYELVLDADLAQLDLHINVDTTASIDEEIDALQRELRASVIDALAKRLPDVSFGVSRFADFPRAPFGRGTASSGDRAFALLTPITRDRTRVSNAVSRLDNPLDEGGDDKEAGAESLYQIATGDGYAVGSVSFIDAWDRHAALGGGTLGGVGFRQFALKVVLHVTDVTSHTPAEYSVGGLPGTRGMDQAAEALSELGVRVIGIMSTDCETDLCRKRSEYVRLRGELSRIAWQTKASVAPSDEGCATGVDGAFLPTYQETCPLVFDVRDDGTGIASTLTDAVVGLLDSVTLGEAHAEVAEDPLGFVRAIEAMPTPSDDDGPAAEIADLLPPDAPDGVSDTYLGVRQRSRLEFRVRLRNDKLAATDREQRFRVALRVLGDGIVLDERTLRIVVPARAAENLDAGPGLTLDAAAGEDAGR